MGPIILYCHKHLFLRSRLGKEIAGPVGSRDLSVFRLMDMFTASTTPDVNDSILESFCNPDGILRVVVATTAFGMALVCPDVRRIIHCGPSSDIEQYLQGTG